MPRGVHFGRFLSKMSYQWFSNATFTCKDVSSRHLTFSALLRGVVHRTYTPTHSLTHSIAPGPINRRITVTTPPPPPPRRPLRFVLCGPKNSLRGTFLRHATWTPSSLLIICGFRNLKIIYRLLCLRYFQNLLTNPSSTRLLDE